MKSSGYKESLNQYQDLVNQPTFADYLGNAFSKVGSGPAVGEAQRMSNAMLSGMGAGISGAAAEERRQSELRSRKNRYDVIMFSLLSRASYLQQLVRVLLRLFVMKYFCRRRYATIAHLMHSMITACYSI